MVGCFVVGGEQRSSDVVVVGVCVCGGGVVADVLGVVVGKLLLLRKRVI